MMLMLLAWEPHLENHRGRPRQTMQLRMGSVSRMGCMKEEEGEERKELRVDFWLLTSNWCSSNLNVHESFGDFVK